MKSAEVINILLLICCLNIFANNNVENGYSIFDINKPVDSLPFSQDQIPFTLEKTESIVIHYEKILEEGIELTEEDLKRLSISYAFLNNSVKSSEHLEEYIKKTCDFIVLDNVAFDSIKNSKEFLDVSKKYKPNLSFWYLLYMYIGLIGVFVAVILNFRKESDRRANFFISLFILFSSLFVIHINIYISNIQFYLPHSLFASIPFSFLYGPLLYFYFKRITDGYYLRKIDILHFIPSVLLFIYFFKYYQLSGDEKLNILLNWEDNFDSALILVDVLKIVSLTIYGILVYKLYKKSQKKYLNENNIIIKWQRNIVLLNSIYVFSHLLYVLMVTEIIAMNFLIHPQIISMSLLVLYVGYMAYVQPKVFNKKYYFKGILYFKYEKSGLTESYSNEIKEQLLELLVNDKVYKENDITLEVLSEKLGTTRHSTSQVINEHFDMNFFNLINKFRIEEAQEIFKSDYHNNLNIIDVAYDVGFNNKVTFNKAFKEFTKLTPTKYINNLHILRLKNLKVNLK